MLKYEIMKRIILFFLPLALLVSCEFTDPRPVVDQTSDELWSHATYGAGILNRAYANIYTGFPIDMDFYTDNAVPRTAGDNLLALGAWTVENNPIGSWETAYNSIKYINIFLENEKDLPYRIDDAVRDSITRVHRRGEAYYLRAWYQWTLLRDYSGIVDGEVLGFPIVTKALDRYEDEIDLPRDTYEDCVAQIVEDLDTAIELLPFMYNGDDIYTNHSNRGRGSGMAAMALKARVYLNAASPAYGNSSPALWERAAQAAYEAIEASGGLVDLAPYGDFNDPTSFDFFWIQPTYTSNFLENQNYPPSLYGNGNSNPSQNLVDAFPASDGYPIDVSPLYDETKPYANRDPRFERFIFFNTDYYHGTYVRTYEGGDDAPGGLTARGTRTGYYMKKQTSRNVRLTPGDVTSDIRFKVYLHKTELYLNFAEAANEAYGPTDATLGISASDVMEKVRQRANPGLADDTYLLSQSASQDDFREFILNERRLELAFEGFRFWDIRRLNQELNHTVRGVKITMTDDVPEIGPSNISLQATPSTDYVSPWERIDRINNGYDNPQSSNDGSQGIYGNWNSAGLWRYVQYDNFLPYLTETTSDVYSIIQSDVYWFSDGGGILIPDSVYIEIWDVDQGQWIEVYQNFDGEEANQWNTVTFDPPLETNRIRLNMKSNTASTGIIEWQVWGKPANPVSFEYNYVNVEDHRYNEFMRYVPLPFEQILIQDNLRQNQGW